MQPKYYGAAAQYNQPAAGRPLKKILLLGGLVIGVLIFLAIALTVISNISKGPANDFARLVARENNLRDLMDKQKSNIRSSDLLTVNATARMLLLSDSHSLSQQLKATFGMQAVPEEIAAAEKNPAIETALKNATLTNTFDAKYIQTLREKIASLYALANQSLNSNGSATYKNALNTFMQNLTTIDDQLSKIRVAQ